MEVSYENYELVLYGTVPVGKVFRWTGVLYMRVELPCRDSTCVNLETGKVYESGEFDMRTVEVVEARVVVT